MRCEKISCWRSRAMGWYAERIRCCTRCRATCGSSARICGCYGYMYGHPGKKLLFMGQEFAQRSEFSEARSLEWHLLQFAPHQGMQHLVRDLNRLFASEPALHQVDFDWHGFEWIDCNDADSSVLSFIRRAKNPDDFLVVVMNATPIVRTNYRVGVPVAGFYQEILNTDAPHYGGSGAGNLGGVDSSPTQVQGRPHSLTLTLPPLAALILKPKRS